MNRIDLIPNVSQDGTTARFTRVAQAVQQAGLLPKESAAQLVKMSKAIRLLTEAQEPRMALAVVDDVVALMGTADGEASEELRSMVDKHVMKLRKALG